MSTTPSYAELHCTSNFSFLKGASHPEEMIERAKTLGYRAIAITDECSVAGIVRAHVAAQAAGIQLLIGSEFQLEEGTRFILIAKNRSGYGYICNLISTARRRAPKGDYYLSHKHFVETEDNCIAIWLPSNESLEEAHTKDIPWLRHYFSNQVWVGVAQLLLNQKSQQIHTLEKLSQTTMTPLVAIGSAHMHIRTRRMLRDTIHAIRMKKTIKDSGFELPPNGENYLRNIDTIKSLFPSPLIAETLTIANQCTFKLSALKYEYPEEITPNGISTTQYLRTLTQKGLARRFPKGAPNQVQLLIDRELSIIHELNYEPYFLTVFDITDYAKSQGILFQGRGSAANSAVCYALGITEVDPNRSAMLFERFISKERNEPPDIDVDFENDRREEVIQYIYNKYGRDRAALAAAVVTYRPKSAFRDAGKALGLNLEQINRISKNFSWWDQQSSRVGRLKEAGFDPDNRVIQQLIHVTQELSGFPRHLSQHVGGFIISQSPLTQLVPVENANMKDRTVIQWDKNDLAALGLLKIDILALGMLSAIRRSLNLIESWYNKPFTISDIPSEDPEVYEMISKADTIGVFQIESRAQMSMLPKMKPKCFYDLVIEIAIVRPGPIQGGMVHPYLERRQGKRPVTYPSTAVKQVLERTLGVPIFQEQVMQLAIVAAGFTPGEADELRRSMAAWKRRGGLGHFEKKLTQGMRIRGYSEAFAKKIFQQILGFGEYGFPESHSASFALLVYVSSWLKRHEPAAFTCALLNSQPMGFYAPAQLVQDAQRHDVMILPVDILLSDHECRLVRIPNVSKPVIRLGFNVIKGLSAKATNNIIAHRAEHLTIDQIVRMAKLNKKDIHALIQSDALLSSIGDRHQANWWANGLDLNPPELFHNLPNNQESITLSKPTLGENIVADYQSLGLSLREHPLCLLRSELDKKKILTAEHIKTLKNGKSVRVAGIVTSRQRPGTSSGVVFVTLEDETGYTNVVIWRRIASEQRQVLINSQLLVVTGHIEKDGQVIHVIAKKLIDYSPLLGKLVTTSRNFH
ncbi:error-prone DNA polymerase [Burkholderiales bacterium]|nr:error-prone DNA polymerase [Burkholderiales bacterium]